MFPSNAWYVACMPNEIDNDRPLGRTICNHNIALYRDAEGRVTALDDFCPHRGAPLSLGRVTEGQLVCGYHGLVMGCEGKALSMPGQRVGPFPSIRRFPVVERHGFVWLWAGDAALANPASIPHLAWAESPEWAYGGGLYHVKCDYRLMIDNLMDLTHETYVHATSIGQREIDETKVTTKTDGDAVVTSRFMDNVTAPPFWQMALRANHLADTVPVDRWQICRFSPPSHVMIEVGVAHAGKGGYNADLAHKVSAIVVDFLTPETDTTMWYFWGMARNFNPKDKALTATVREGQGKIFSEDLHMLEAQQANLLLHPQRALLNLNIDSGGVQSRRVLDRILTQERS
jgi:vanillate O-demethylase monooxygenase subunit